MDEAVAHLRQVLNAHPRDPEALKNMAWILATSPDPALRDGAQAVQLVESAPNLTPRPDPIIGANLAAAYAEAGRFSDALPTAEAALQLANNNGQTSLAQLLQKEVELYQIGLPFRDAR
jgi:tetratricopeptide (TPR) repeat protein